MLLFIKSFYRRLCEKKKNPMNNAVKRDAILDEELGYWVMTIIMAIVGAMMIGIFIVNFIL